jgi:hypothetical protein
MMYEPVAEGINPIPVILKVRQIERSEYFPPAPLFVQAVSIVEGMPGLMPQQSHNFGIIIAFPPRHLRLQLA